jgi:hypothetical protein
MIQPDVQVMFLDPDLNGMPGLTTVDFTIFAGDAVVPDVFKPRSPLTD